MPFKGVGSVLRAFDLQLPAMLSSGFCSAPPSPEETGSKQGKEGGAQNRDKCEGENQGSWETVRGRDGRGAGQDVGREGRKFVAATTGEALRKWLPEVENWRSEAGRGDFTDVGFSRQVRTDRQRSREGLGTGHRGSVPARCGGSCCSIH